MPVTRIDQLKKVIETSKTMNYQKGKGDELPAIIEAIEAQIGDDSFEATTMRNVDFCYYLYKHIMDHTGYLTSGEVGDNNIMIAYSLLSALDGELAKNVEQKINKDHQIGLNLYNFFGRNVDAPMRDKYLQDGPEQIKKYNIRQIEREKCNPLDAVDLRKIENIRNLYKFMTKQAKTIFHTDTADYEKMCREMKHFLDYVDTAKDSVEKAMVSKGLEHIAEVTNTYIGVKIRESKDEKGPRTPLGKARFAAAFAVLKTTDSKRADQLYEKRSAVQSKFENKLVDQIMKKSAEAKIEVKPRANKPVQAKAEGPAVAGQEVELAEVKPVAEEPVQAKAEEPVADEQVELVDVKPLVEEAKAAKIATKADAIKALGEQLENLQIEINSAFAYSKWKKMAEYVVLNEIKRQVLTKGDEEVIDRFNVDENVDRLMDDKQGFIKVAAEYYWEEDAVDMKEFCKTLPQKIAEIDAYEKTEALKEVAENAFVKNKVEEKNVDAPVLG